MGVAVALPQAASAESKFIDPAITDGTAAKELSAARNLWKASGIRNYRFSFSASCFCLPRDPVKIKVRGSKVRLSDPDWFGPRTVPGLFKVVQRAIGQSAARLDVTYSRTKGVPRRIAIDEDRMITDEEVAYTVSKFRKIRRHKPVRRPRYD